VLAKVKLHLQERFGENDVKVQWQAGFGVWKLNYFCPPEP
jgi:hypothetical protein